MSLGPALTAPRALALAVALALGCDGSEDQACPGQPIAAFALQARRVDAATSCVAGPEGGWASAVPATIPAALAEDPTATFSATLSLDPPGSSAALCTGRSLGAVLVGSRVGDRVHVEASAGSAVLAACAGTCSGTLTVIVDGDLLPAGADAPTGFTGTLIERMDPTGADCGPCTLPCAATYALEGTAR